MNTLVVYDSNYGNTRMLAEAVGQELQLFGPTRTLNVAAVKPEDIAQVELLIIGGPTHAHGLSAPMRQFTDTAELRPAESMEVAAFDTRFRMASFLTGSAAKAIAARFRRKGVKLVAPPESFFVTRGEPQLEPGELERAKAWARGLYGAIAQTQRRVA